MGQNYFTSFGSTEEMLDFGRKNEEEANVCTLSWQRALKLGDYFISNFQGLIIYNEIIQTEPLLGEYPFAPNHVLVRAFSVYAQDGEAGDAHLVTAERQLTRAQFEKARQLEWPNESKGFVRVLLAD